jgi:DNA-3-methyladenine glycosylase II
MKRAYDLCGAPEPRVKAPGYKTLLRAIVDQQVSVQSGAAIWQRLEQGMPVISPVRVLDAGDDKLRSFGFSRPKARYARCLANAIVGGDLDIDGLDALSDTDAITALTSVIGIGRWTAEVYLMFALGRQDILPAGDVALAASAGRLMDLAERPDIKQLDEIAYRWKPWRTSAALMLWHFYKRAPLT